MRDYNTNRKKGGRPPKAFGQKKSYRVNLKLMTEEYYSLIAKVRKSNTTTISGFIRSCLQKGYVKERLSVEQTGYIRQLSGMANNLNQIARQANAQGYTSVRTEYLNLAGQIDDIIKMIAP